VSRLPDLDDFLDPKTLTPQGLYRLQSDTWAQGAEFERERIIKLLEDYSDGELLVIPTDEISALIKGEQK
jgi:hypothetical protein